MRVFIGIAMVCLLGSCASVGKGVFIKRKYNRGYHIDLASHKRSVPAKGYESSSSSIKPETEVVVVPAQKKVEESVIVENKVEKVNAASIVKAAVPETELQTKTVGFTFTEKLKEKALIVNSRNDGLSDGQLAWGIIGFVVLTIIYFLAILIKSPGFPIALALLVAMIGALLTLLTGVLFI